MTAESRKLEKGIWGFRADGLNGSPAIWHSLRVMMQGPSSSCWVTGARCSVVLDEADLARNLSDRLLAWPSRDGGVEAKGGEKK